MDIVAGIDGCSAGWLYVSEDLTTGNHTACILSSINEVLLLNPRPDVISIDIPIGLTDFGPRQCDIEARAYLGWPRRCSVFPSPIRPILNATTREQACEIGQATDMRRINKQTWAIIPKTQEVDTFLRMHQEYQSYIREVHPEVSFCVCNSNSAMSHKKKSALGRQERELLVCKHFGQQAYSEAQASLSRGQYANDDLLDAFVALWTAERIKAGEAIILPTSPLTDRFGLRMEIVA